MAREQGPMSGFRDLLADQMIPREAVLTTIKGVYESYGFVPLKTPALERYETLTGKYGEEGEGLIYHFTDHGDRHVALRYDQTVPLARVVAQHGNELPNPYKRYAVGDVWRGESPQAGRYREFMQFDADIVGSDSPLADAEIVAMMSDAMSRLGVSATIRVNDRRLLDGLAQACGVDSREGFIQLTTIIDKVEKVGRAAVLKEVETLFDDQASGIVDEYLSVEAESADKKLDKMSELLANDVARLGIDSLRKIFGVLRSAGYDEDAIVFDQSIARGLSYYTGTIYETMLDDLPEIGSVCSGGRFDNLIEQLGGPDMPAVGTSIGVDRLMTGMRQLGIMEDVKTNTQVYITNVDPAVDSARFELAKKLRDAGVAAEIWYGTDRLGKQFKAIERLGVQNVVILGGEEAAAGNVTVKNLATGEQHTMSVADLVKQYSA